MVRFPTRLGGHDEGSPATDREGSWAKGSVRVCAIGTGVKTREDAHGTHQRMEDRSQKRGASTTVTGSQGKTFRDFKGRKGESSIEKSAYHQRYKRR